MHKGPGGHCFVYTQETWGTSGDNFLWRGTWLFLTFSWILCLPGSGLALCLYHPGRALQRGLGLLQGMSIVNEHSCFTCAPKALPSVHGELIVRERHICLYHFIAEETERQWNRLLHWFVYPGWGIISYPDSCSLCNDCADDQNAFPVPGSVCSLSDMKARRQLISPITED